MEEKAVVLPPIRCVHCGKVLGHLYTQFCELVKTISPEDAFNRIGLKKICCRISIVNPPVQPAIYRAQVPVVDPATGRQYITSVTEEYIRRELEATSLRTSEADLRSRTAPRLPYVPKPAVREEHPVRRYLAR